MAAIKTKHKEIYLILICTVFTRCGLVAVFITISVPVRKVGHIRIDTLTQRNLQRVLRSLLLVYKYGPQTTSPLQR